MRRINSAEDAHGGRSLADNIRWGIRFGLIFAAVLIAFVSIGYVLRPNSPSHQMNAWLQVFGSYLAGGVVCGLVLGACRPLITSLSRSILLGPVIAFPFYAIIAIVFGDPFWQWDSVSWVIFAVGAVMVGAPVGGFYWQIFAEARYLDVHD